MAAARREKGLTVAAASDRPKAQILIAAQPLAVGVYTLLLSPIHNVEENKTTSIHYRRCPTL
jgi:hypothetical protein